MLDEKVTGVVSLTGVHYWPLSFECHRPPSAPPSQMSLVAVGLTAIAVTRPVSVPSGAPMGVLFTGDGPSSAHPPPDVPGGVGRLGRLGEVGWYDLSACSCRWVVMSAAGLVGLLPKCES